MKRALPALLALACSRDAQKPPPVERPLEAELSGCAAIVAGTCEIAADRVVRVWAALGAKEDAVVSAGGRAMATSETREVQGGKRWKIELPAGARELRAVVDRAGDKRTFEAKLADAAPPSWLDDAKKLRQKGDHDA